MAISAKASEAVEIIAEPELARQLAAVEAAGKRPILVRDGVRYRVDPVEAPEMASSPKQPDRDPWADYEPEKVRQGVEAAAGTITVEEAERMKEYIYVARRRAPVNRSPMTVTIPIRVSHREVSRPVVLSMFTSGEGF